MAPGTYGAVTKYTILSAAGGVTGAFDDVLLASAFYTPTLSSDFGHVYLTLTRNALTLGDFAQTPNQEATADAVETAGLGAPYFDELFLLPAADVPDALDALSGDGYPGIIAATLDDGRFVREAALDRRGARGIWMTPFGGVSHLPGDGNGPGVDHATGGLLLGADTDIGPGWFGVLLGYGQSRYAVPSRNMSATSGELNLGAYGGGDWQNFYASFGAALTARAIDATRHVVLPGVSDTYGAQYASLGTQAFTELGFRIDLGGTTVTPFGGLAGLSAATTGATETGSGPAALAIDPATATALVTTLGLRLGHDIALADQRTLTLRASAAWRHAAGRASTTGSMAGAGPITVAGAPLPADTVAVSAGTALDLDGTSIGVDYTGSFGSGGTANAATATLAGRF
jgi:outer membrane autotransporter protein